MQLLIPRLLPGAGCAGEVCDLCVGPEKQPRMRRNVNYYSKRDVLSSEGDSQAGFYPIELKPGRGLFRFLSFGAFKK